MNGPGRVAICIPSGDLVHTDFALSLGYMLRMTQVQQLVVLNERRSLLPDGRNALARRALEVGADWLLWLDSDMTFPADTLERLLRHRVPFVGANYLRRVPPHTSTGVPHLGAKVTDGLLPMVTIGLGCVLVHANVFRAAAADPWFTIGYEDGQLIGEDVGLCRAQVRAGGQVWCDVALSDEVGHIGIQQVRMGEARS